MAPCSTRRLPAAGRSGKAGHARGIAGDVADPAHRRGTRSTPSAELGRLDLLVNNASTLGPSPQPRPGRLPARRDRAGARRQRRRPAGADPADAAAAASRQRHGRRHHVRRRRRGLRRLGRLRLVEGRARAVVERARRRGSPTCASTGSTPATCAPRCTRRRSPARTSPTGRCPRPSCRRCVGCSTTPPSGRYRAAEL